MSGFPREDYRTLNVYDMERPPVEIDLSDNTNLWGPHPAALEVIRSVDGPTLTRYPSLYSDGLRDEVAARFGVDRGQVTAGCGSDDVLDSLMRAACRAPGLLSYAAPTFVMAEITARMNGLETHRVPWDEALAQPERLLSPDPDIVYLCTPNNPSGAALDPDWVRDFLDRLPPDGPVVILDEAYADYHGRTLVSMIDRYPRTFIARTLSKLYALAGMRIGYGISSPEVILEVEKSRGPFKLGALAEAAAVAALKDESGWTRDVIDRMRVNRARLIDELAARGMAPHPSVTNFLLVPVAPLDTPTTVRELARRGISVRPFPGQPVQGDSIRITVGPWEQMQRFLEALDEIRDA